MTTLFAPETGYSKPYSDSQMQSNDNLGLQIIYRVEGARFSELDGQYNYSGGDNRFVPGSGSESGTNLR